MIDNPDNVATVPFPGGITDIDTLADYEFLDKEKYRLTDAIKKSPLIQRLFCDPAGIRTLGPNIKSVCALPAELRDQPSFFKGLQKIQSQRLCAKSFSINYQQDFEDL